MEENNKFETNTDSSGSGSMLYGEEPQQQAEGSGYSSVYGMESQPQATTPVQLAKPLETEPDSQDAAAVQVNESSESATPPQVTTPVQLAKPLETEQLPQVTTPVQLAKTSSEPQPQIMTPQQAVPMQSGQFYQPGNGQPNYYGQPLNGGQPNQNLMEFGPVQVPPPVQGAPAVKTKKNNTGIVAGILCAAAVVIAIVIGALAVKSLFGNGGPRQQLAKGIANMTKEMAAYRSSVADDIGLDALNKLKDTAPVHTNIDFSFTDPNASGSITSINIEVDGVTDYKKKMAEYGLSAGAYGFKMNIGNIVAADNTLYLSAPMVFQKEVYSLELTNLGRDFNNSAWASLVGETLPEDYSVTLFEDANAEDGDGQFGRDNELLKIFQKQGRINAESMKFETIDQKREFTFDGTSAEYGGVRVTMDKDAYNESMEAIRDDVLASEFYDELMKGYQTSYTGDFGEFREEMDYVIEQLFGLRFEQDPVIDFYLDKKGRIVNISTPEDIAVSGQDLDIEFLAVDIDFAGTERTLDSIEGGIYVQAGDEILYMGISRTASITEDYYSENLTLSMQENNSDDEITFWYANKWGYSDQTFDLQMSIEVPDTSIGIRAEGAFTDIVKGESYTFQLNHGALTMDGEDMLLMTGSIGIEPADNTIEVPENATNVFEMSESDIEDLLYGIMYY